MRGCWYLKDNDTDNELAVKFFFYSSPLSFCTGTAVSSFDSFFWSILTLSGGCWLWGIYSNDPRIAKFQPQEARYWADQHFQLIHYCEESRRSQHAQLEKGSNWPKCGCRSDPNGALKCNCINFSSLMRHSKGKYTDPYSFYNGIFSVEEILHVIVCYNPGARLTVLFVQKDEDH